MRFTLDYDQYAALARQTAAEGCVLLKNEKAALPIRKGETVSVFGRIAFTYYKSGTGSGGMVNAPYVTNILDSLKECKDISVNEELEAALKEIIAEAGAAGPQDMGKVMGVATKKLAGKAEGRAISAKVKELLG